VNRLEELLDEPRPGAPRSITDKQVEAVVTETLESMPESSTHWSSRLIASVADKLRMRSRSLALGRLPDHYHHVEFGIVPGTVCPRRGRAIETLAGSERWLGSRDCRDAAAIAPGPVPAGERGRGVVCSADQASPCRSGRPVRVHDGIETF
jgi:hypothetical protein